MEKGDKKTREFEGTREALTPTIIRIRDIPPKDVPLLRLACIVFVVLPRAYTLEEYKGFHQDHFQDGVDFGVKDRIEKGIPFVPGIATGGGLLDSYDPKTNVSQGTAILSEGDHYCWLEPIEDRNREKSHPLIDLSDLWLPGDITLKLREQPLELIKELFNCLKNPTFDNLSRAREIFAGLGATYRGAKIDVVIGMRREDKDLLLTLV